MLVLRARPCGGFAFFASCRGAAPLFCAHTALPTRLGVGVISVRACGAAPVVGVFACGWLGFVFTRGACSCGCLRALVLALWWGGGAVWSRRPFAPACLFACSRSGVGLLAFARLLRARWAEGGNVGAGHGCPAPIRCWVAMFPRCVRVEEKEGAHGVVNTILLRSPTWGRVHPVGVEQVGSGASWGGIVIGLGGGGVCSWCERLSGGYNPRPGSRGKRERGRGRGRGSLRPDCVVWVGCVPDGGTPSFGCEAWCWGCGAFPLVVGLVWW